MTRKTCFGLYALIPVCLTLALEAAIVQRTDAPATLSNAIGMQFVRIAPGEFMMGCYPESDLCFAPEKPARRVQITKAFEIGRYEVTQTQWQAVMGANPSLFKGDNLPVERVGWNDVQQFLEKLNARNDGYKYRLPTEAEWEFAARAGGNGPTDLGEAAWYDLNSKRETHPVGQKQPNAWGLYDTLGNVSEWVQDWFALDYYSSGPSVDPPGPATGVSRVMRGGSFAGNSQQARVAYRVQMPPSGASATMGFRCVRTPG